MSSVAADSRRISMTLPITLVREDQCFRAALAVESGDAVIDAEYEKLLVPSERERLAAFKHYPRRREYLMSRSAAKRAIRALFDVPAHEIEIASGVFSQPIVRGTPTSVGIALTHSKGVCCAMAYPIEHPLGIDIEREDSQRLDTIRTQVGAEEIQGALEFMSEATAYTMAWTAKEALSKVMLCGLTTPFSVLGIKEISAAALGASWTGRYLNFGQYRFHSWLCTPYVLTCVAPHRTRLEFDEEKLRGSFQGESCL